MNSTSIIVIIDWMGYVKAPVTASSHYERDIKYNWSTGTCPAQPLLGSNINSLWAAERGVPVIPSLAGIMETNKVSQAFYRQTPPDLGNNWATFFY